jgi:hypothetical protein
MINLPASGWRLLLLLWNSLSEFLEHNTEQAPHKRDSTFF